jgi:hypothetical protein
MDDDHLVDAWTESLRSKVMPSLMTEGDEPEKLAAT